MNSIAKVVEGEASLLPACPATLADVWNGATSKLRVVNIIDEAPDVKTFVFQSERPALFNYKAGQFLTLELPATQGPLLRTYTIASSPSRPMALAVTVKAQVGSVGTRWMFENLVVGSLVKAIGPAGTFTLERSRRPKLLFVSAGSGVTPMMSMLRWLSDVAVDADIAFVHCARSPQDIMFHDELALASRTLPRLKLGYVVGQRTGDWSGFTGRLDIGKLESLVPDYLEREMFCCGPGSFMAGVQSMIVARGFAPEHFHQEAFTFAPVAEPLPPASVQEVIGPAAEKSVESTCRIRFNTSGIENQAGPDETVLEVARRNGVAISSVCEMGLCGTCRVKKTVGEVEMQHNGGITDDEIDEGYILACCSKPLSDVEIEA